MQMLTSDPDGRLSGDPLISPVNFTPVAAPVLPDGQAHAQDGCVVAAARLQTGPLAHILPVQQRVLLRLDHQVCTQLKPLHLELPPPHAADQASQDTLYMSISDTGLADFRHTQGNCGEKLYAK